MPYGWFWFDGNGRMATGWMTDASGNTFYLNTEQKFLRGHDDNWLAENRRKLVLL